jgi:tetratricopeptide (TPR) repeat protein
MIEAAIDQARCVIVIWSVTSTNSDWVRAEAAEGLERGVLVPVLFDDVRPPLLFRQQQACRLIDWPDLQAEEFEKLLISAKRVLAAERSTNKDEPRQVPSVTVLLADFQNETDIDVYSGSIDEALRLSLEDVAGVYIYPRDQAIHILNQGALDIEAATRLGAREGLDFIVGGRVHELGLDAAFEIEIRPIADPEKVVRHTRKLGGKETVAKAVTELTSLVLDSLLRRDPLLRFHSEQVTAVNLEALQAFNSAQRLASEERFEEAIPYYERALARDPDMGRAAGGWAFAAYSLGQVAVARDKWRLALKNLERMTEVERLRTLGAYYALGSQNYEKAAETYQQLLQRSPFDATALNNVAVVTFSLLDFGGALDLGRRALEVFPDSVLLRGNYALYAMYASDFETARREAEAVLTTHTNFVMAYVPLAIAALMDGDPARALEAYARMKRIDTRGAAIAPMAIADLAMATGDWAHAIFVLGEAIEIDRHNENTRSEAQKLLMLAECNCAGGDVVSTRQHLADAQALKLDPARLTTAASVFVQIGDVAAARVVAKDLRSRLGRPARAYGRVVEANCLAAEGKFGDALDELKRAVEIADVWCAHLLLAEVLVRAGHPFEGTQELDACIRRRGEATAMYLDDVPTLRFVERARKLRDRASESL